MHEWVRFSTSSHMYISRLQQPMSEANHTIPTGYRGYIYIYIYIGAPNNSISKVPCRCRCHFHPPTWRHLRLHLSLDAPEARARAAALDGAPAGLGLHRRPHFLPPRDAGESAHRALETMEMEGGGRCPMSYL